VSTDGKAVVAAFRESLYARDWPRLLSGYDHGAATTLAEGGTVVTEHSGMADVTAGI
jgi:hypothetical protein